MSADVERHQRACSAFTAIVDLVRPAQWSGPTPCSEWDAGALVEHVIGFHDFLLLRPAAVRAERPRSDPAQRWRATDAAIRQVLASPAILDRPVEYFDGATRRPREMLPALTTDVLVHTWDLGRAIAGPDRLDPDLCERALRDARRSAQPRQTSALFGPVVPVPEGFDSQSSLLALLGRDPLWQPLRSARP
jgi:uncharacterized protein (TIGR03086 family)